MKPSLNKPSDHGTEIGKGDRTEVRSKDNPIGIDDIGLPGDVRADDARPLPNIHPTPARTRGTANPDETPGSTAVNPNQSQSNNQSNDHSEPPEEAEKTSLEKAYSKIVPPSHEVRDADILDPGRMTPGAPPVDNRS